jgi:hypothetical protein
MSNDRDQEIVTSAISDTGSGLLEFLSALGQREAIAFGDGVALPVRIRFDELPTNFLPRSSTARFSERWLKSTGDEGFLDSVVERWRTAGIGSGDDQTNAAMLADALAIPSGLGHSDPPQQAMGQPNLATGHAHEPAAAAARPSGFMLRKDTPLSPLAGNSGAAPRPAYSQLRRDPALAAAPASQPHAIPADASARVSLRERLMRPQPR